MSKYEVKDVVCDYGLYENDKLKLIFGSRQNALAIKRILEVDSSVPNQATVCNMVEVPNAEVAQCIKNVFDAVINFLSEIDSKTLTDYITSQINQAKQQEWIPCSEKLPPCEQFVLITCKRKHVITGEDIYFTAMGFYENGEIDVDLSQYCWSESDFTDYDEEEDICTVIKGWYEAVVFSEEFSDIDCEVLAWMPLSEAYTEVQNG